MGTRLGLECLRSPAAPETTPHITNTEHATFSLPSKFCWSGPGRLLVTIERQHPCAPHQAPSTCMQAMHLFPGALVCGERRNPAILQTCNRAAGDQKNTTQYQLCSVPRSNALMQTGRRIRVRVASTHRGRCCMSPVAFHSKSIAASSDRTFRDNRPFARCACKQAPGARTTETYTLESSHLVQRQEMGKATAKMHAPLRLAHFAVRHAARVGSDPNLLALELSTRAVACRHGARPTASVMLPLRLV